jgi:hypothetical protein
MAQRPDNFLVCESLPCEKVYMTLEGTLIAYFFLNRLSLGLPAVSSIDALRKFISDRL